MGEHAPDIVMKVLVGVLVVACLAGAAVTSPILAATIGGPLVVVAVLLAWNARRHAKVVRVLAAGSRPGELHDLPVRWRPLSSHAGVAGLRRPTIFCDPQLPQRLTADELRALVLHERCHQLRRDPLRLVVLASIDPLVRCLSGGRQRLERWRGELEIRADRHALDHGATRPALARTLLKLDGPDPQPATVGFATAVELRLRALLDPDAAPPPRSHRRCALLGSIVVLAVCGLGVAHHMLMGPVGLGCVLAGC